MTTLSPADQAALARKYSGKQRRAMKAMMKAYDAGDTDLTVDLGAKVGVGLVEAQAVIDGVIPEISPEHRVVIRGYGLGHPDHLSLRIKHGVSLGLADLAKHLGLVDFPHSYEEWLADPETAALLGLDPVTAASAPVDYTDEQFDAMYEAAELRSAGVPAHVLDGHLAAAGLTRDDFTLVMDGGQAEPVAPSAPAPTPVDPSGLGIKVPAGVDLSDSAIRARIEAVAETQYGKEQRPVCVWPREADASWVPVIFARPRATYTRLVDTKSGAADRQAASLFDNGAGHLVLFDPYRMQAAAAHLDPLQHRVRSQVAARLGVPNHEVELVVHVTDERVDQVIVLRAPMDRKTAPEREMFWHQIIADLPGGGVGWTVVEEAPITRLIYGDPPRLPGTVDGTRLLPPRVDPSQWHLLPTGVMPSMQITGLDLAATPHTLVVGPTGSGKTVALVQIAIAAMARGHEVHIMDPTKSGLDFLKIKPFVSSWGATLATAQAQIQAIYTELERRKAVMVRHEKNKWSDLPAAVREAEGIQPLLLIIDEYGSLVIETKVPASLAKDHPLRAESEAANQFKAIVAVYVGKLAREARFAGISLVIGIQRPDANIISGEMREQLGSKIQLIGPGKPISREALAMVFPGDLVALAQQQIAELDDGRSKGLALVAAEGGSMAGFRVAYLDVEKAPAILDGVGVPRRTHWDLEAIAEANRAPVEGELIRHLPPAPPPASVEPEITFSLDDLEAVAGSDDLVWDELAADDFAPVAPVVDEFAAPPAPPAPTWDVDPFD